MRLKAYPLEVGDQIFFFHMLLVLSKRIQSYQDDVGVKRNPYLMVYTLLAYKRQP